MLYFKQARQALICFPPQPEESADNQLVLKVFPYFLFVSSLFLIATFLVYALIPEIRNIHGNDRLSTKIDLCSK